MTIEEIQTMLEQHLRGTSSGVLDLEHDLFFFRYTSPELGPCYGLVDLASKTFFLVRKDSMHRVIAQVQQIEAEEQEEGGEA